MDDRVEQARGLLVVSPPRPQLGEPVHGAQGDGQFPAGLGHPGGLYAGHAFAATPPLTVAVGNFLASAVLLLPFAPLDAPARFPSAGGLLALLALVLVPTALALTLDFRFIQRVGSARASGVAYLIPAFGALYGAVFLAEPVGPSSLIGLTATLLGVALVNGGHFRVEALRPCSPGRSTQHPERPRTARAGAHRPSMLRSTRP